MELNLELGIVVFIASLGFISVAKSTIKLLDWVWVQFLRPAKDLRQYGSWALVTGPTDGIGKAMALELASRGLNLVLVGRNVSKLRDTASEIEKRIGDKNGHIQLKTVAVDLAKCGSGSELCDVLGREITDLDIGVVVNNAGLAYPYARFFHEVDSDLTMDIIKVNVEAATWITRAVLPGMLKKKRGAIINIGSAATLLPSYPLFTLYAASKAYLAMLSRSIGIEYKKSGIDIQCQVPLLVATKMSRIKQSSLLIVSPETYSKASMKSIGYELLTTPCWSHSVQLFVAKMLPDFVLNRGLYSHFVAVNKLGKLKDLKNQKISESIEPKNQSNS